MEKPKPKVCCFPFEPTNITHYCNDISCKMLVCSKCLSKHKSHQIKSILDMAVNLRKEMESEIKTINRDLEIVTQYYEDFLKVMNDQTDEYEKEKMFFLDISKKIVMWMKEKALDISTEENEFLNAISERQKRIKEKEAQINQRWKKMAKYLESIAPGKELNPTKLLQMKDDLLEMGQDPINIIEIRNSLGKIRGDISQHNEAKTHREHEIDNVISYFHILASKSLKTNIVSTVIAQAEFKDISVQVQRNFFQNDSEVQATVLMQTNQTQANVFTQTIQTQATPSREEFPTQTFINQFFEKDTQTILKQEDASTQITKKKKDFSQQRGGIQVHRFAQATVGVSDICLQYENFINGISIETQTKIKRSKDFTFQAIPNTKNELFQTDNLEYSNDYAQTIIELKEQPSQTKRKKWEARITQTEPNGVAFKCVQFGTTLQYEISKQLFNMAEIQTEITQKPGKNKEVQSEPLMIGEKEFEVESKFISEREAKTIQTDNEDILTFDFEPIDNYISENGLNNSSICVSPDLMTARKEPPTVTLPNAFVFYPNQATNEIVLFDLERLKARKLHLTNIKIPKFSDSIQVKNRLFICGGEGDNKKDLVETYEVNANLNILTEKAPMLMEKALHTLIVVSLTPKLKQTGFNSRSMTTISKSARSFTNGSVTKEPSFQFANHMFYGYFIFCVGGHNRKNGFLNVCEKYNVVLNNWTEAPKLNEKKQEISGCSFNESIIYLFGGIRKFNQWRYFNTIEVMNAQEEAKGWSIVDIKSNNGWNARNNCGCTQISEEHILIFGGFDGKGIKTSLLFNCTDGTIAKIKSHLADIDTFHWRKPFTYHSIVWTIGYKNNDLHIFSLFDKQWKIVDKSSWHP